VSLGKSTSRDINVKRAAARSQLQVLMVNRRRSWQSEGRLKPLLLCLTLTLSFSLTWSFCASKALAQASPTTGGPFSNQYGTVYDFADAATSRLVAQTVNPTTALPTDVVPLPESEGRNTFGDRLQFNLQKKLPSRFYFLAVTETSLRDETNVYQTPSRAHMLRAASAGIPFGALSGTAQASVLKAASIASKNDGVFRVLPNVTAGWALTPKTRVFANYFLLRDQLFHQVAVNTLIESVGGGIQHDFTFGRRGNLQVTLQARELYQNKVHKVFDYLPGITYSHVITPRTVAFASAILQMRGKQFAIAPAREIDPFFSVGVVYQRGGWQFSHATTFLQNFRQPFGNNALIPINNYAFVLDFEVARRVIKKVPGLQVFVRAEPIWNLHSNATPGLSGMDFRIFCGVRLTVSKASLLPAVKNIQQQFNEHEVQPPPPKYPGAAQPQSKSSIPGNSTSQAQALSSAPKSQTQTQPSAGGSAASAASTTIIPAVLAEPAAPLVLR
jgi:hypothetical protein